MLEVEELLLLLESSNGGGGGGGGMFWFELMVPLSSLAFNWARELLTVSELDELVLLEDDVESDDELELLSDDIGGGGGGGIWPMKLREESEPLVPFELEELEIESRSWPKLEYEPPVSAPPESGPPRLAACWMSLKVAAAESVSPEAR